MSTVRACAGLSHPLEAQAKCLPFTTLEQTCHEQVLWKNGSRAACDVLSHSCGDQFVTDEVHNSMLRRCGARLGDFLNKQPHLDKSVSFLYSVSIAVFIEPPNASSALSDT